MTETQDPNIGSLRALYRALMLVASLLIGSPAFAQGNPTWSAALAEGSAQRMQGNLTLALENLDAARRAAVTPSEQTKALLYLNLGIQARALGTAGLQIAYRSLDQARRLLAPAGNSRALVEDLDALAQLYEDQGRTDDALYLTREALAAGKSLAPNSV